MVRTRRPQSWNKTAASWLAICYSVLLILHLLFFSSSPALLSFWTIWFAGALAWLNYPLALGSAWWGGHRSTSHVADYLIALAWVVAGAVMVNEGWSQIASASDLSSLQVGAGSLGMLVTLELLRRVWGSPLAVIATVVILVSWLGIDISSGLSFDGLPWSNVIWLVWYSPDGAFGRWAEVMAYSGTVIILLGALIEHLRRNEGVNLLSDRLTSRVKGGPVLSAVVSSAWFGMVDESVTANVASTGVKSIPEMQSVGASPSFAAATEAAASTGGQLIPPIMTVAAFAMADALGVSYFSVALAAVIPSLLYYVVVVQAAHSVSCREGLHTKTVKAMSSDDWGDVAVFFMPVLIMVVALACGLSVAVSGLSAIMSVLMTAKIATPKVRTNLGRIRKAAMQGGLSAGELMLSVAVIGMVYAVLQHTGLAAQLTGLLVNTVGSHSVPLMFTGMLVVLALGTSLPTLASYLFAAMIFVPALEQSGMHAVVAHMVLLYYAVLAHLVPPAAPACEAAAPIAEVSTNDVSQAAGKYVFLVLFVPFVFAAHPGLLLGVGEANWSDFAVTLVQTVLALGMLGSAVTGGGWHTGYLSNENRLMRMLAAGFLLMGGAVLGWLGFALMLLALLLAFREASIQDELA